MVENSQVVGRITLFQNNQEGPNKPVFTGYLETSEGKQRIALWEEPNPNVTGGAYYRGQVTKQGEGNDF
jgi:hypothetical protein